MRTITQSTDNGLNVFCENCQVSFRFALHSHVSPIYKEARAKNPDEPPNGRQIYSMIANRELQEAMACGGESISWPSKPLQNFDIKKASSHKPIFGGIVRGGSNNAPLVKMYCPVCNNESMKLFKSENGKQIELDCKTCRGSFNLTRTDNGSWVNAIFKPGPATLR